MAGPNDSIVSHYGQNDLFGKIIAAFEANGKSPDEIAIGDLKPIDEFHIGGFPATLALLDPLGFGAETRVLDVGSGLGGTARHMVQTYGAQVTGVDLTPEFVETARKLSDLVGLDIRFEVGSALDLPFADDSFDAATILHVGMNLPDKTKLFAEVARVLVPGGVFAVYDVMLKGTHPPFPLPWAEEPSFSFLEKPESYLAAGEAAGFTCTHQAGKGEVAKAFFAEMQRRIAESGPPAVGLPLLMGETAPQKAANMAQGVGAGDIEPVEMIFRKPG